MNPRVRQLSETSKGFIADRNLADVLAESRQSGNPLSAYRMPIVLCYLEGLTHDEAAVQLGWPVGSVKGRLARGRARLDLYRAGKPYREQPATK